MIKQYLIKLAERDILTILYIFAAIGIIGLIYDLCLLIKRKIFGEKYLLKFKELVDSGSYDKKHHQWLLRNVTRIENEMGGYGRANFYRPAFANYAFQNYAILSNVLLNINPVSGKELAMTQAILDRYVGALGDDISKKLWELINPFVWLTRAVRCISIDIPLWIFRSVGLISTDTENKFRNSSLINKIIGIITVLGSLASLLAGWDSVVKFFHQIFGWLGSIGMN